MDSTGINRPPVYGEDGKSEGAVSKLGFSSFGSAENPTRLFIFLIKLPLPNLVMPTYNPSTCEVEARGTGVQG